MTVKTFISGTEISASTLEGVTITTGRQDARSSVNPTTCSVSILYDSDLGTYDPSLYEIGEIIRVQTLTPSGYLDRFYGRITDLQFDKYVLTITGVTDGISRFGRFIADFDYGSGDTGDVLTNAYVGSIAPNYPTAPAYSFDTGVTYVTTPALTNFSPAEFVQRLVASEPNSMFYERVDGALFLRDQEWFRSAVPDLTFLSTEIADTWQVTKRIGDKINSAVVDYDGGSTSYTETADTALYGKIQTSISTYCDAAADALNLATRTVKNYVEPGWTLPEITVPMSPLTSARREVIRANSSISNLVEIPVLTPGLNTKYVIQGYTERLGRYSWDITLYLADWSLFRPAQNWNDIVSGITWAATPVSISWDDMLKDWI
jgi:hypothetical protein